MLNWQLSRRVDLRNERVKAADARRQEATAREIIRRFDHWPGVVLADEVGMGKTYVALAAAVSAVEATNGERPVVVMVPPSVQEKWPREWDVFQEKCLDPGEPIRTTGTTVRNGAEFLKLLDDPTPRRNQIVFLTHGALTNSLNDPLIRMAIVRRALRRPSLASERRAFPRWADRVMPKRSFWTEELARALLESSPRTWRRVYQRVTGAALDDDPVPAAVLAALKEVDLGPLINTFRDLPLRESRYLKERLHDVRESLGKALADVWTRCLHNLDIELPLLILDEAHHLKNPWSRKAMLFATETAQKEAELLKGPLADVFDRMLFLTATPLQLGHYELLQVLQRFSAVRWADGLDRDAYRQHLKRLGEALDVAQSAALRLDRAWGTVGAEDLDEKEGSWWRPGSIALPEGLRNMRARYGDVNAKLRDAEELLRPLVIRHSRVDREDRRRNHPGRGILEPGRGSRAQGLEVEGPALLPFLLAARTQGLLSVEGLLGGKRVTRAHFAEGLASSFEAYRNTRSGTGETRDDSLSEDGGSSAEWGEEIDWYLRQLDATLPDRRAGLWGEHPKIKATAERAAELWEAGEKTLVFCFYRATGRALRAHISRAIDQRLMGLAAKKLRVPAERDSVMHELGLFRDRFWDPGSPVSKAARRDIRALLRSSKLSKEERNQCVEIVLRFMATPAFLARYLDLRSERVDAVRRALETSDASGRNLREKIRGFGKFVAGRVPEERAELLDALEHIATGEIAAGEEPGVKRRGEIILPSVRLASGEVARDVRRRLMLAFNTPFFPDVLVASSVMAEGVDLHLCCRHVIHHDLDWNPSVLEQRTGRLDRIGSHGEVTKKPIEVFEPFIEGTQDEKCFRVAKDRERWFNVVMGERLELEEFATDKLAARVPFPEEAAKALALDLSVAGRRQRSRRPGGSGTQRVADVAGAGR